MCGKHGLDVHSNEKRASNGVLLEGIEDLSSDVLAEGLGFVVRNDPAAAERMSCTSKNMRRKFLELMKSNQELKGVVSTARRDHVAAALESAKRVLRRSECALMTTFWLGGSLGAAGMMAQSLGKLSPLNVYPNMVLAYSVLTFSRRWDAGTAKALRLMFDFSLSYAGNVFITLQVNSSQSVLALAVAMTSTVHALILSVLMMSASVQATLWHDLNGSLHKAQSMVMLVFYMAITLYYGGLPGIWKLASACCRLFMVIHLSWMWVLPKLTEDDPMTADDNANDDDDDDNGIGNGQ